MKLLSNEAAKNASQPSFVGNRIGPCVSMGFDSLGSKITLCASINSFARWSVFPFFAFCYLFIFTVVPSIFAVQLAVSFINTNGCKSKQTPSLRKKKQQQHTPHLFHLITFRIMN